MQHVSPAKFTAIWYRCMVMV